MDYRYWIDTNPTWTDEHIVTLYRVELDDEGEDIPDSETQVWQASQEELGIPEDADIDEAWEKTDKAIIEALGFLPEYEVN